MGKAAGQARTAKTGAGFVCCVCVDSQNRRGGWQAAWCCAASIRAGKGRCICLCIDWGHWANSGMDREKGLEIEDIGQTAAWVGKALEL